MAAAGCIAVDWGTTSLRAALLDDAGAVLDRVARPKGILAVDGGRFADELAAVCGAWRDAHPKVPVLMAGMIGSRQGWFETPYLDAPCGLAELAAALSPVPDANGRVCIMPGVAGRTTAGTPEIMRGEETQIGGVVARHGVSDGLFCIPGTHSKWVRVAAGRIEAFATFMTGEAFAMLKDHSILGRLMPADAPHDPAAFRRGLAHAETPGSLLHRLFATRTLGISGEIPNACLESFLSGQLIGAEIAGARQLFGRVGDVHLLSARATALPYADAFAAAGIKATRWDAEDAAIAGLWTVHRTAAA